MVVTRPVSRSEYTKAGPSIRYRPFQPIANLVSVSSTCIGLLSPSRASPTASRLTGSSRPGIAGFGGEQDQLTDGDDAAVVIGCPALNIAHLIGETKTLALHDPLARSTPDRFSTPSGPRGDCHGIVHTAVRRSAGLRLPLLRPHCHLRLPQRAVAARAGSALLPSGGRGPGGQQGDPQPAHRRLPELGGRLRPQSAGSD